LELYYFYNKDNRAHKEERHRFDAYLTAFTYLSHLKKVYKKIHFKELYLIKQGLYELESKKRGSSPKDSETVLHSPVVESLITLRSPLTNSFFNPSFSLLPNLVSSNTP